MPARSKSTAANVPHRNILLLEEYDALAAAITSALKKFAPGHGAAVARSITDAEKLAANLDPELFVIDVDPPWRGLTNFLEKIRAAHPDARVLVIGAGVPAEIVAARAQSGALQFIEKPFDLAAFGAAVQALLGPWRDKEGRGTLRALSPIDVLLAHCAANASVIVDLRSRARTGEIHVASGQIVHAQTGRLKGEDALLELLGWTRPRMTETKLSGSARRTISNWKALVLGELRERDEEAFETPEAEPIPSGTGKKIVVVDDTDMLLIFVEDILSNAEPQWQITTALSGTEGLQKIESILPDLVLLDYSLPDFNGDELCERLLENERTSRVPVLMMSGHVAEMTAAAARLPNVVAKIEKPFFSETFVDLVRQTLDIEHEFEADIQEPLLAPAISEPKPEPAPAPPPPIREKVPSALPRPPVQPTTLAPAERHIEKYSTTAPPMVRVAPTDGNAAVLGIFLEVLSMQLTSQLQMGAIKAKPSALIGSLRLQSASARNAIPSEIGFQLGPAKLSGDGRISSLRLIPTSKPFQPAPTRTAFEIGGVAVIPNETRARVQLTPAGTTPMTMELFAHLELSAVELSSNFQVAQLILNWNTNAVRVTLNPKAPEQTAAKFELRVLKLDDAGRISELLLNPAR